VTHLPTSEFLNGLISHSFLPTICYPTRITETSATLIDNIFINDFFHKFDTAIIYSDMSDHLPMIIHFNLKLQKLHTTSDYMKRNYTEDSVRCFQNALQNTDFSSVCFLSSVSDPTELY